MIDSHRVRWELKKHIFQFPYVCAKHGANLAGASPATGFYRQV